MSKFIVRRPYVNKNTKQYTLSYPKKLIPKGMKPEEVAFKIKPVRIKKVNRL